MKHYQKYSTVVLFKKENFNYEISIACCIIAAVLIFMLLLIKTWIIQIVWRLQKLDYISKEGADHIASQCNAFIKQKIIR